MSVEGGDEWGGGCGGVKMETNVLEQQLKKSKSVKKTINVTSHINRRKN